MVDPSLGAWAQGRLTASWRGVPFRVRESQVKRGRRQAVHEYPFRDTVWVEDLGRATRVVAFRGFIVGDDVDAQLQAMDAAAERPGDGLLVHPVLGPIACASLASYVASESFEHGRVFLLEFEFVLGAPRSYPAAAANSQGVVLAACPAVSGLAGTAFGQGIAAAAAGIGNVAGVVAGVERTVGGFVSQAAGLAQTVSVAGAAATGLAGNFGRFSLGARLGTVSNLASGLSGVTGALNAASASAASVVRIGASARALAGLL